MNGAKNVTATFTLKTYTITASAGSGGSISPSGTVTVNYGGSQSFTITPDANYTIGNVVVDGVSAGSVTTYNFANVTANHTISASFTAVQQNSLNVTKAGTGTGTVTSSPAGINCGSRLFRDLQVRDCRNPDRYGGCKFDLHRLVRGMHGQRDMLGYHGWGKERNSNLYPEDLYDNSIRQAAAEASRHPEL